MQDKLKMVNFKDLNKRFDNTDLHGVVTKKFYENINKYDFNEFL
jgi:hypothetical protein